MNIDTTGETGTLMTNTQPFRLVLASIGVLVVFVIAAVVLIVTGHDDAGISVLGTGVTFAGALLGLGHLTNVTHETREQVTAVAESTDKLLNGEMERKVRRAVGQELALHAIRTNPTPAPAVKPPLPSEPPQGPVRGSNL